MNIFHKNGKQSTTSEKEEQTQTFIEYKLQNQVFLIISLNPHSNSWVRSETMSSRLRIWACHFSLASYLSPPLANTPLTLYEQFKELIVQIYLKILKPLEEGQLWNRLMDSEQALKLQMVGSTGHTWTSLQQRPTFQGQWGPDNCSDNPSNYHLMIVSLYKWISGG